MIGGCCSIQLMLVVAYIASTIPNESQTAAELAVDSNQTNYKIDSPVYKTATTRPHTYFSHLGARWYIYTHERERGLFCYCARHQSIACVAWNQRELDREKARRKAQDAEFIYTDRQQPVSSELVSRIAGVRAPQYSIYISTSGKRVRLFRPTELIYIQRSVAPCVYNTYIHCNVFRLARLPALGLFIRIGMDRINQLISWD